MKITNVNKFNKVNKSIIAAVILAASLGGASMLAFAQADSGNVPPLRGTPSALPLTLQERETPQITNNSYTTQQITQQITQVVQPNTYQETGYGSGRTNAQAWANCGAGKLLSGGGSCTDNQGLVAVAASEPIGNSWVVGCSSLNYNNVYATAYAICSAP